jgi:ferritin-like metal-binding protein YciE
MARELFAAQLRKALWIERKLVDDVQPGLIARASAPELVRALERHLLETREHARVVGALLRDVVGTREPLESPALLGLLAEHERLPQSDLACCLAAAATELLELALYDGLIAMADALDEQVAAAALRELVEQEEFALEEVERARTKLLAEKVESR